MLRNQRSSFELQIKLCTLIFNIHTTRGGSEANEDSLTVVVQFLLSTENCYVNVVSLKNRSYLQIGQNPSGEA